MNIKQLKDIIKIFEDSSLVELRLSENGEQIVLKKGGPAAPLQAAALLPAAAAAPPAPAPEQPQAGGVDFNRIIEVTSPVVGVFYEAPEPGGKPFVQMGDLVQRGDVLCLIEVMKQVTEVTAPQNGQVVDICVSNGNVVEYGQTLVKIC